MSAVYLNTFAEGATIGNPEEIDARQLPLIARTWKRSHAIVHYELFGTETIEWKGIRKEFLIGDIGSAKLLLPRDPEFSGLLPDERPDRLLSHRIAAVVEDYDLTDEANRILVLNRKKALDRLQELNARRLVEGEKAYGVIQATTRGAYLMNVGGYNALMPRFWYDWDSTKRGSIGEGFEVLVRIKRDGRIIVSRCHLLPNPLDHIHLSRGARVRARITHISRGTFQAEIQPGVRVRVLTPTMYRMIHVGDHIMVEIRDKEQQEFVGVVV